MVFCCRPQQMRATLNEVQAAAARLQLTIPAGHEEDYLALLDSTEPAVEALLAISGENSSAPLTYPLLRMVLQTTRCQSIPLQAVHRPTIDENLLPGGRGKSRGKSPSEAPNRDPEQS